jgi:hypothetical protein
LIGRAESNLTSPVPPRTRVEGIGVLNGPEALPLAVGVAGAMLAVSFVLGRYTDSWSRDPWSGFVHVNDGISEYVWIWGILALSVAAAGYLSFRQRAHLPVLLAVVPLAVALSALNFGLPPEGETPALGWYAWLGGTLAVALAVFLTWQHRSAFQWSGVQWRPFIGLSGLGVGAITAAALFAPVWGFSPGAGYSTISLLSYPSRYLGRTPPEEVVAIAVILAATAITPMIAATRCRAVPALAIALGGLLSTVAVFLPSAMSVLTAGGWFSRLAVLVLTAIAGQVVLAVLLWPERDSGRRGFEMLLAPQQDATDQPTT